MYSFKSKNVFAESVYAGTSNTIYDLPAWFLKSNFSRNSSDLIAELNGDKIILVDFLRIILSLIFKQKMVFF